MKILAMLVLVSGLMATDATAGCFGRSAVRVSSFGTAVNVNVGRVGLLQRFRQRRFSRFSSANVQVQVAPVAVSTVAVPASIATVSSFTAVPAFTGVVGAVAAAPVYPETSTASRARSLAAELNDLRSAVNELNPPVRALSRP